MPASISLTTPSGLLIIFFINTLLCGKKAKTLLRLGHDLYFLQPGG